MKNTDPTKFDSLGQCSAATGIPVLVLKRAKRAGCPAFRSGRVELLPFVRWHFEQGGADDLPGLQIENMRLTNAHLEAKTAVLKNLWMPKVEVEKIGSQLGFAIRRVVESLHLNAPSMAGLDTPAISKALKEQEAEIMRQLHELPATISTWAEQAESESADTIIAEPIKPSRQAAMKKILNPDA